MFRAGYTRIRDRIKFISKPNLYNFRMQQIFTISECNKNSFVWLQFNIFYQEHACISYKTPFISLHFDHPFAYLHFGHLFLYCHVHFTNIYKIWFFNLHISFSYWQGCTFKTYQLFCYRILKWLGLLRNLTGIKQ